MIDLIYNIGILLSEKLDNHSDNVGRCLDFYGDITDSLEYKLGIKTEKLNNNNEL